MTTRTITAIYDSESEAQQARAQLLEHGVEDADVRILSHQLTSTRVGEDSSDDKGIWESIKDFFVGDDDRGMYSEGLRRGGCLLTARVSDERSDEAIAVLEGTNAVDLDQRTEQWRAEGWSDSSGEYLDDDSDMSTGAMASDTQMRDTRDQQSIPVVEERLRVGKREVDRGGVRVRSYVVEEPVRENVSLREERVEVERRPGGRAGASPEMFREQTIEVSERGEEAVIAKDAVVTEEVVVRKTTDERTETVEDTVRHTEVDVEDTRGNAKTQTPAGNSSSKPRTRRPS